MSWPFTFSIWKNVIVYFVYIVYIYMNSYLQSKIEIHLLKWFFVSRPLKTHLPQGASFLVFLFLKMFKKLCRKQICGWKVFPWYHDFVLKSITYFRLICLFKKLIMWGINKLKISPLHCMFSKYSFNEVECTASLIINCGHFEPILNKFGSYLPKLIGLAHDICPKMIFGILRSKLGKIQ